MEISWRLAWATLMMTSIANRLFPVPEAILSFVLAVGLTRLARGRGWRWITIIGLQGVGCVLITLRLIYAFNYGSLPFFSRTWLHALFRSPETPVEWLLMVLTIFWALVFWWGGIQQARRSAIYRDVCLRFDVGFGLLFGLLLLKIVLMRDGAQIQDPVTAWLIAPFFLFGLMAIGLARQRGHAPKTYIEGHRTLGILLSAVVLTLVLGIGVFAMFWPYFALVAEVSYELLKAGAHPLESVIIVILRFLLSGRRNIPSTTMPAPESNVGEYSPGESSWWMHLLEKVFSWGFGGLIAIIAVVVLGIGLWRIVRWLFSKTPKGEIRGRQSGIFRDWLLRLQTLLNLGWEWLCQHLQGYNTTPQIYAALLNWGKHSGLPHKQTETPLEYGIRLSQHFPTVQPEVIVIIDLFQQEIYAELTTTARQVNQARRALRRLRSPAFWGLRIRFWFRGDAAATYLES